MIGKFLRTLFLSSALGGTAVQAEAPETDRFVCVTENADGNPAALFETSVPLYTENGTDLNFLGRSEEYYAGSSVEGSNLYSRDEQRLKSSVEGYEAQLEIGVPSYTTEERHRAQLEQWRKGLNAVRSGTHPCESLTM